MKNIKADMIQQEGSRAVQKARVGMGKGPANIFNREGLAGSPEGHINLGIKGDANLQIVNEHVSGIKRINPETWTGKTNFRQGVSGYKKGATGAVLHTDETHASKSPRDDEGEVWKTTTMSHL